MHWQPTLRAICLALAGLATALGRANAQPSLEEVLRQYQIQFEPLKRCTVRISAAGYQEDAKLPPNEPSVEHAVLIHRDQDRWKIIVTGTFQHNSGPKLHRGKSSSQMLVSDDTSVHAGFDPDTNALQGVLANRSPAWREALFRALHEFHATYLFFGVLPFDEWPGLSDILTNAQVATRFDQLDGRQMVRADANGPWGRQTIWFDPERGYQVRRARTGKLEGDLVGDGKTLRESWSDRGRYNESANATIDVEQFQVIDGKHLPARFVIQEEIKIAGSRPGRHQLKMVVTVDEVTPNPRFPRKTFSLDDVTPDGTRVTVEEEPTIAYEWQDGEIEKVVNRSTLERLAGNPFRRGAWLSRGLLILAGICLAVVGYRLVRRFGSRAKA
jgi:hypothetical protein